MNLTDMSDGLDRIARIANEINAEPDRRLAEKMYWINQISVIANNIVRGRYSASRMRALEREYHEGKKREYERYLAVKVTHVENDPCDYVDSTGIDGLNRNRKSGKIPNFLKESHANHKK